MGAEQRDNDPGRDDARAEPGRRTEPGGGRRSAGEPGRDLHRVGVGDRDLGGLVGVGDVHRDRRGLRTGGDAHRIVERRRRRELVVGVVTDARVARAQRAARVGLLEAAGVHEGDRRLDGHVDRATRRREVDRDGVAVGAGHRDGARAGRGALHHLGEGHVAREALLGDPELADREAVGPGVGRDVDAHEGVARVAVEPEVGGAGVAGHADGAGRGAVLGGGGDVEGAERVGLGVEVERRRALGQADGERVLPGCTTDVGVDGTGVAMAPGAPPRSDGLLHQVVIERDRRAAEGVELVHRGDCGAVGDAARGEAADVVGAERRRRGRRARGPVERHRCPGGSGQGHQRRRRDGDGSRNGSELRATHAHHCPHCCPRS